MNNLKLETVEKKREGKPRGERIACTICGKPAVRYFNPKKGQVEYEHRDEPPVKVFEENGHKRFRYRRCFGGSVVKNGLEGIFDRLTATVRQQQEPEPKQQQEPKLKQQQKQRIENYMPGSGKRLTNRERVECPKCHKPAVYFNRTNCDSYQYKHLDEQPLKVHMYNGYIKKEFRVCYSKTGPSSLQVVQSKQQTLDLSTASKIAASKRPRILCPIEGCNRVGMVNIRYLEQCIVDHHIRTENGEWKHVSHSMKTPEQKEKFKAALGPEKYNKLLSMVHKPRLSKNKHGRKVRPSEKVSSSQEPQQEQTVPNTIKKDLSYARKRIHSLLSWVKTKPEFILVENILGACLPIIDNMEKEMKSP